MEDITPVEVDRVTGTRKVGGTLHGTEFGGCPNCYYYAYPCGNCCSKEIKEMTMTYAEFLKRDGFSDELPKTYEEFLKCPENPQPVRKCKK